MHCMILGTENLHNVHIKFILYKNKICMFFNWFMAFYFSSSSIAPLNGWNIADTA